MVHRDEREATRARADAAARDLADARREVDELAPQKERLQRENQALRAALARLRPPHGEPARTNLVAMSIALGSLTTLLVAGLSLATLITRGTFASVSAETAPTSPSMRPSPRSATASHYLVECHDEVRRLVTRRAPTANVERLLRELIDYDTISQRSLGAHWEMLGLEQRAEFTRVLRRLIETTNEQSLQHFLDFEIRSTTEEPIDGGTGVRVEMVSRITPEEPVEVVYSMHRVGTAWRIFDISTNGMSLVRAYHQQFDPIVTQHGYDELIARMQRRLARPSSTAREPGAGEPADTRGPNAI